MRISSWMILALLTAASMPAQAQQVKSPVVGTAFSGTGIVAAGGTSQVLTLPANKLFLVRSICADRVASDVSGVFFSTSDGPLYAKFTSGCTLFEPGLVVARNAARTIRCQIVAPSSPTGTVYCAVSGILVD